MSKWLNFPKIGYMANRKITWSKQAITQFSQAIEYVAHDSIQNAEKVRVELLEKINHCRFILKFIRLINGKKITMVTIERSCCTGTG